MARRDSHLSASNLEGVGSVPPPVSQAVDQSLLRRLNGLQLKKFLEAHYLYQSTSLIG
jgi:hypothetical protein